jgi:hypothetical protein
MKTEASVAWQVPKPGSLASAMQLKLSGHKYVLGWANPAVLHGSRTQRTPSATVALGRGAQKLMQAGSSLRMLQETPPAGQPPLRLTGVGLQFAAVRNGTNMTASAAQ